MTAQQEQSPAAEKEEEEIVASKYRHNAYIGKTAVAGAGAALFAVLAVLEFVRGRIVLAVFACIAAAVFAALCALFAVNARRIAKLPEDLVLLRGSVLTVRTQAGEVSFGLGELASAESAGGGKKAGTLRFDLKDGNTVYAECVEEPDRAAKRIYAFKEMYEYRLGAVEIKPREEGAPAPQKLPERQAVKKGAKHGKRGRGGKA